MKDKIAKLLNVKSIITLILTLVFCIMTLNDKVSTEQFMTVFTTVIAFYFGTQHQRRCDELQELESRNKT